MNLELLLTSYEKFNDTSVVVFSLIAQNELTPIAEIRDLSDLETQRFNATLGTLRKWNLIEKNEQGLYQLTEAGKAIVAEAESIETSEPVKIEVESIVYPKMIVPNVVQPVQYKHKTKTKQPKQSKPKVESSQEYTVEQLDEFEKRIIDCTKEHMAHSRTDSSKTRYSVRFVKNSLHIRAFEMFTKGVIRIYSGAKLPEPLHEFVIALSPQMKEGTHWYYDLRLEQFEELMNYFSK